ncbi:MAG TPA: hypothetical protein VFK14_10885 [Solirubrobacterales bacterium]|nr:hypothetical protein [Solirubrobacterales bacterium]
MSGLVTFLLPALPLLGLLAALLLGRYPGCEAIVRISERIAERVRRSGDAARSSALLKPHRASAPHGGLLIALGLAQRPPPLPA